MTVLFTLVGGSVGPAIAGIIMQANQVFMEGVGSYPSSDSYKLIFFTIALASLIPIALSIFVRRNLSSQSSP
jgi:hypothetical protein